MPLGHQLVLALSLGVLAVSACGTEGQTPVCTTFPELYDVRDEQDRLQARDAIAAAARERCLTLPADFEDAAGAGGAAGATGPGGAAGGGEGGAAGSGGATGGGEGGATGGGEGGASVAAGASGAPP